MIQDSLAWQNGSNLYHLLPRVPTSTPAAQLVNAFLIDVAVLAEGMLDATCQELCAVWPELAACKTFLKDCKGAPP